MNQTIIFNPSLDSEKKNFIRLSLKNYMCPFKKKKVDHRKLLKITPKKKLFYGCFVAHEKPYLRFFCSLKSDNK
jgi:hypothetical protein